MQINFFILIAQIVNFLVLVFLLKRFLYSRIINAMDQREKRIASRLEGAEKKKEEALKEGESYRSMKQELADKRQETLAYAREEAEHLRQELSEKARSEVEEKKAKWYEAIEREKEEFLKALRQRASEQILEITRQALYDLANDELERHIINTFIKRLKDMKKPEKEVVKEFSEKTGRGITVKSAFEISRDERKRIEETLREQTSDSIPVEFEIAPDLISGIELSLRDTRISWNLKSYLDSLEQQLSEAIGRKTS